MRTEETSEYAEVTLSPESFGALRVNEHSEDPRTHRKDPAWL